MCSQDILTDCSEQINIKSSLSKHCCKQKKDEGYIKRCNTLPFKLNRQCCKSCNLNQKNTENISNAHFGSKTIAIENLPKYKKTKTEEETKISSNKSNIKSKLSSSSISNESYDILDYCSYQNPKSKHGKTISTERKISNFSNKNITETIQISCHELCPQRKSNEVIICPTMCCLSEDIHHAHSECNDIAQEIRQAKEHRLTLEGKSRILNAKVNLLQILNNLMKERIVTLQEINSNPERTDEHRCKLNKLLPLLHQNIKELCSIQVYTYQNFKILEKNFKAIKQQYENICEAKKIFAAEVSATVDRYNIKKCIFMRLKIDEFFRNNWSKQRGLIGLALLELGCYFRKLINNEKITLIDEIYDAIEKINQTRQGEINYQFVNKEKIFWDFDNQQLHWFLAVGTIILKLDPSDFQRWKMIFDSTVNQDETKKNQII